MKINIKHWLIAAKSNHYHPKLFRPLGLVLVVISLVAINLGYNLSQAGRWQVLGYATNISSGEIINLTNQQRQSHGLSSLVTNSRLNSAAAANAQYMFAHDYWSHYAPDGTSPWSFVAAAGYKYVALGQNLAKDFYSSADVVDAWMASAEHRADILDSSYTETGVAVANGTLQGEQTTLIVAFYAQPQPALKSAPPSPTGSATATGGSASPPTEPRPTVPTATASTNQPQDSTQETKQPVKANSPVVPAAAEPTQAEASKPLADIKPVSIHERNWAQDATLFVLTVLLLLLILRHTIVWRTQKRGWRHIWLRAHPAAQYFLLIAAIVANLATGVGTVL